MSDNNLNFLDNLSVKRLMGVLLLVMMAVSAAHACDGPHKGEYLNKLKLKKILNDNEHANLCGAIFDGANLSQMNLHGLNLEQASFKKARLEGSDLSRASLIEADFSGAILNKTYFRWANLSKATLSEASLNKASFVDANLDSANFSRAKIQSADFSNAQMGNANFNLTSGAKAIFNYSVMPFAEFRLSNLIETQFIGANASNANFNEANLSQVNFTQANLSHAYFNQAVLKDAKFKNTILTQTDFQFSDLENAIYLPSLIGTPQLGMLATAKNFKTIEFYDSQFGSPALNALQVAYKNVGIRPMERLITSMIKEHQMRANFERGGFGTIEGLFSYIFFYITCDFGLSPSKPIFTLFIMMLVLSLPYYLSLGAHSPHSGIIVAWSSRRDSAYLLEASYQHFVKIHPNDPWIIRTIKRYRRLLSALYFSLLRSFRIGWQDFNLAVWITLIQTKDYHFIARGWVRSLAGLQSIISAYLLILWALTYFGRPFDW